MSTAAPAAARVAAARIVTANASRYLQQLCKHFAHKLPETTFDPDRGRIPFQGWVCDLDAAIEPGVLRLRVTAGSAEDLDRLTGVVASHLVRFAFREDLAVVWTPDV